MAKKASIYVPYFAKLKKQLAESQKQENPALWLYKNDARTCLFMIESLARIQSVVTLSKEAKKLHKFSKKFEDALGKIDYYYAIAEHCKKNKAVGKNQVLYFNDKLDKAALKLNKRLLEKNFFKETLPLMEKISSDFDTSNALARYNHQMKNELAMCAAFFNEHKQGFTSMEDQVHELRRKIRWISIYAQSFQGRVVLKKPKGSYKWEKEFITPQVQALSYNKLPVNKNVKNHISFNQKAFYAMSYVIRELGSIKDNGLLIEALAKCLKKTLPKKPSDAIADACKMLGIKQSEEQLLAGAHNLLGKYFNTYKIHAELC